MPVKHYPRWGIAPAQKRLIKPLQSILFTTPPLLSGSNKPLAMNTEELLNILTYYHLQDFSSGRELIQALQEDDYAKQFAPAGGIKRSTFFDTVNDRGVEQLLYVFTELQKQAAGVLPSKYSELGDLVAIDGSLIDSVLSMHWAEYRTNSKKAKLHLGLDLNHSIPRKLFLSGVYVNSSLRLDFADNLPLISGDRIQLQQVLFNLWLYTILSRMIIFKSKIKLLRARRSYYENASYLSPGMAEKIRYGKILYQDFDQSSLASRISVSGMRF